MNYQVFDTYPTLKTERLTLQLHEEGDAESLFELRSDPAVMKYMDAPLATDKSVVLERIKEIRQDFIDKKGINLTIKLNQSTEAIGYMSLWKIDHTNHRVEIGYALKKQYWNQGISTEAAKAVIDFAFYTLQAHSIKANINPDNIASENFLKKLSFQKEAHFREDYYFDGKYLDSVIYCLLESDWSAH